MSKHYYTDEKNAQIVIALLKAHGIRRVIANPGTTNISIVGSIQNDPWFQVYSGVDERHSAYMAVGMATECGEPVVLSCTGATASRNYIPALTEAYYRKIPVLAITSMQNLDNIGQLSPQALDRSSVLNDMVVKSVVLRTVKDAHDYDVCVRKVNEAILALKHRGGGPVHINLEMGWCMTFGTKELPCVKKIERITEDTICSAPRISATEKIALFIGSGRCSSAWERFAASNNVAVFADCGSGYVGVNKVSSSLLCSQMGCRENPGYDHLKPSLIINVGEISGDYPSVDFLSGTAPVWRISEDGEIRSRFGNPDFVFEMSAEAFANHYVEGESFDQSDYAKSWIAADKELRLKIPELPFSNPWIAQQLSQNLPNQAILHLGILNSLRSWNLFPPCEHSVVTYSNVGGFGIDGGMSTLIGASIASREKLCFGVFGDLAFFYDLNSLGNRHIGKNIRILLVNNGCGGEFNMFFHPGSQFGDQTNDFIASGGHFGSKSHELVRHYAEDLGFCYLSAENKESFLSQMPQFLNPSMSQSIIFECFTTPDAESEAHRLLNMIDRYKKSDNGMAVVKKCVPQRMKNIVKAVIGK